MAAATVTDNRTIKIIYSPDPPAPPKGCSVEEGVEGALRVFCEGGTDPPTPHAPGLSYVRSPQARTVTSLEVSDCILSGEDL